jgi:hypothetical protein
MLDDTRVRDRYLIAATNSLFDVCSIRDLLVAWLQSL